MLLVMPFLIFTGVMGWIMEIPDAMARKGYRIVLCRGPVEQLLQQGNAMTLVAHPGIKAGHPRSGECVWQERAMDRRGESNGSGKAVFHITLSHKAMAAKIREINLKGGVFRLGARRVSGETGLYEASFIPD
jgi:hypothetical protein